MITLWQPKIISNIIQTRFTKNAGIGAKVFVNLGPMIRIPKIPAIHKRPCVVLIPKSACLNTSNAKRTTTPATLFPEPNTALNSVTKAKQKATTRYTLTL